MSRRSRESDQAITPAADEADPDAEAPAELAAATLTGDLRDFILDRLKFEQSKRPWHERSEADQRDTVHQVEVAVSHAVRQAVEIIAGGGLPSIRAMLDSVTVKDGIKAVVTLSRSDERRHALVDATGCSVLVVVADAEQFTGERAPVVIVPDQGGLPGVDEGAAGAVVEHAEVF